MKKLKNIYQVNLNNYYSVIIVSSFFLFLELDSQTENTLKDLTNLKGIYSFDCTLSFFVPELFLCLEKALDNIDLNPDKNECVKPGR